MSGTTIIRPEYFFECTESSASPAVDSEFSQIIKGSVRRQ